MYEVHKERAHVRTFPQKNIIGLCAEVGPSGKHSLALRRMQFELMASTTAHMLR